MRINFKARWLLNRWLLALWLPTCLLIILTCGLKLFLVRSMHNDQAAWAAMDVQSNRVWKEMQNFLSLPESEVRTRLVPGQELQVVKPGDANGPPDFYLCDRILQLTDPQTTDHFFLGIKNGVVHFTRSDNSSRTASYLSLNSLWLAIAIRLDTMPYVFMGYTFHLRGIPCLLMGCWVITLATMLAMWRWHRPVGQIALALAILTAFALILDTDSLQLFNSPSWSSLSDAYTIITLCMLMLSVAALITPMPRGKARDHRFCLKCHYDLTGNQSGICPECGTPVAEAVHRQIARQLDALSKDQELDGASLDDD